jgi:hypothetical protein
MNSARVMAKRGAHMKGMSWARAAMAAAVIAFAPMPASASIWVENGDAGQLLGTAQHTGGMSSLLDIFGWLSADPSFLDLVDLYSIYIPDPTAFQADTGDGSDPFAVQDPALYLFDNHGRGVYMNDDGANPPQSTLGALPSGFGAGVYYLAISFAGVTPIDTLSQDIFDALGSGSLLSSLPLAGWIGSPFTPNFDIPGGYNIALAGALGIPEPGTLALVLGALLLGFSARRARP